jgi:hypothetical protein
VRATDDNGNRSFWKYGPTFAPSVFEESSSEITYSAGWAQESLTRFHGGAVKYASAAGESAKLTFTGRNVAWVTTVDCSRGVAEVYLDGSKVASKDLCPSDNKALYMQLVYSANGLDPSVNHTLEIKVVGTTSRPRVDVDAFVVLR